MVIMIWKLFLARFIECNSEEVMKQINASNLQILSMRWADIFAWLRFKPGSGSVNQVDCHRISIKFIHTLLEYQVNRSLLPNYANH